MALRRRLIYWLLKEYIKQWGKTIVFSFIIGILGFFTLRFFLQTFAPSLFSFQKEYIGVVGTTPSNLPPIVLQDLSRGLTKVSDDDIVKPDIATSWKISSDGKTYTFAIRPGIYFTDGKELTSTDINYNFIDVKVQKPNKYIISFTLKDRYSPFLSRVSRPIFKNGLIGVGNYKIKEIKLNGDFLQSMELSPIDRKNPEKVYKFRTSTDEIKMMFLLGDVSEAYGLYDDTFRSISFEQFPNVIVQKKVNYGQLATLFYNTQDKYLSNRDVRIGLTYALPDTFLEGRRTYTFYPPVSWAYSPEFTYSQDLQHAKSLTEDLRAKENGMPIILDIKTLPKYKETAEIIALVWEKIGVQSVIETVDSPPTSFQIYVGEYSLLKDPDQYPIWHSGQEKNITRYENKRIDKLLEDGRKTVDTSERKKIYEDLQKYLLAEAPAAFLYFPYDFTLIRK